MGTRHIAFLRAINVGGRVVKMAELKKIFEAERLREVETFIASGNVIFSAAKESAMLERQLEAALEKALGYTVAAIIRSFEEVAQISEYEPFDARQIGTASVYVGLLQTTPPAEGVKKVLAMANAIDDLHIHGRELYWLARQNVQKSTVSGAAMEKALKTPATFRNLNTIRRLAAKYPSRL